MITVCLNSLLVTQWVICVLVLSKSKFLENAEHDNQDYLLRLLGDQTIWRIFFPLIALALDTIIMFRSFDLFPSRIRKIESKMFKINLDLIYFVQAQSNENNLDQTIYLVQRKLEESWLLYDHVCRIAKQANFKFMTDTYYSKKCLLLIFSNTISFLLLYMQVLDVFTISSNVVTKIDLL